MKSIRIVLPYFGRWPFWIDFFLLSCRFNPSVSWLLIGDSDAPGQLPDNVVYRRIAYSDYLQFVSDKLLIDFRPLHPYKLCDLKPMYGFIHEADLSGYDFWGFCDIDIICGDLRHFLDESLLTHDVISAHATRLSGHFALLRNSPVLCAAFRKVDGWKGIICDQQNRRFDESSFTKLFLRYKKYPAWLRSIMPGFNPLGVKCSFVERHSTPHCRIPWVDGSRYFPSEWYWDQGRLTNNASDRQFMYLHFLYWKQNFWKRDYKEPGGHLLAGDGFSSAVEPDCHFFRINETGFHSA